MRVRYQLRQSPTKFQCAMRVRPARYASQSDAGGYQLRQVKLGWEVRPPAIPRPILDLQFFIYDMSNIRSHSVYS